MKEGKDEEVINVSEYFKRIYSYSTVAAYSDETATDTEQKGQSMKHLTMEEIVVTDEAITEPTATVVGVKTIEKGKNTNIPDVLEYEPGIDISRRALVGDTGDTLKIRGLSGNRIMLNIDGRPVNAAGVQGGYFIDWSTIPLDNIEKIEVMYGGSSVKYGNNAEGGVINVITKKPTEKPTLTFYGTYGGGDDINSIQNYRITHTYKVGPIGYSIAGSYQKSNEFLWNNDYEAKNLAGKFYIDMPLKGDMTLGLQYTNVTRGFAILNRLSSNPDDPNFFKKRNPDYPLSFGESFSPGAGNVTTPGPGADWNKTKYLLDFGYKQPIGAALVEFKAYKNYEDRDEKNYSASWINSNYSDGKLVLDRTVKSDRSYGGSLEFSMPVKSHEINAGIERKVISTGGQDVHFVDVNYGVKGTVSNYSGQSAHMWGYYLQDSWSITDKFLLTPGIRYDTYEGPQSTAGKLQDDGISLSLTGSYRLTHNDMLTASVYRKMLTPSAPDAAWWSDGYGKYYTTDLKLEKNNAVELAYQHNFSPRDSVRLSFYHYLIDDFINRFSLPDGRGCYNIDKVKLTGASIDGAAEILTWVIVRGNITYQKSKKEGDILDPAKLSDELDYLPEWKGNLGIDFKLPYSATFSVTERVVDETQTVYSYSVKGQTNYKLVKLDPFATTDIELKVLVTKHGEIGIYAENLFDKRYEERFGYPLPGRIIGASLKMAL
jgi:outer membrane receptor protein involved in Fe transport